MKLLTFDYKDLAGNETHRTVITIKVPEPNYMVYDVSDLNVYDQKSALKELQDLDKEFDNRRNELLDNYAILKIRSFKPERMTNMVS